MNEFAGISERRVSAPSIESHFNGNEDLNHPNRAAFEKAYNNFNYNSDNWDNPNELLRIAKLGIENGGGKNMARVLLEKLLILNPEHLKAKELQIKMGWAENADSTDAPKTSLREVLGEVRRKVFGPTKEEKRRQQEIFEQEKEAFRNDFRTFDPNADIDATFKMALRAEKFSVPVARVLIGNVLNKDPNNEEAKMLKARIG